MIPAVEAAEALRDQLLSDDQVKSFIVRGFHLVRLDPADPVHAHACRELAAAAADGEPADDLYYDCPALQSIVQRPQLRGALTSLLGTGYRLFTHRHGHVTPPTAEGAVGSQSPHQDGSFRRFVGWNRPWRRHHRPRVLLAFYYPHDVTAELGPTGIAPGSHYYRHLHDRYDRHEMHLVLPAGTVALCHFNLWHRATANRGARPRFMVKLLFRRHGDPAAPSWGTDAGSGADAGTFACGIQAGDPGRALYRHPLIWQTLWSWLRGEDARSVTVTEPRHGLPAELEAASEAAGLDAAYRLGLGDDETGVAALAEALAATGERRELAPFGLSVGGSRSVEVLRRALRHADPWVRATAADTLGDMGPSALAALPDLRASLVDGDPWVRHNALEAFTVWGEAAEDARAAVTAALQDEEPFVRFNAVSALAHLSPTPTTTAAIEGRLVDEHERVRYHAGETLRRMAEA